MNSSQNFTETGEPQKIRNTQDPLTLIEQANDLKELGLVKEAMQSYEQALRDNLPPSVILPPFLDCLLQGLSWDRAVGRIEEILGQSGCDTFRKAQIKYMLGLEMEKRSQRESALELYKQALALDASNKDAQDKFRWLSSCLSSGSRYGYLLNTEILTADQLQRALSISKKMRRSVEFVLIHQFKIKKSEIGKSLSLFYRCPFKAFDPQAPVPVELISNLKKPFLLHDLWVPLSWDKKGVEILIDDPRDLRKTDQLRALIKTRNVSFCVGIKEDIEEFIHLFFDRKKEEFLDQMIEDLELIPDVSFEEEADLEEEQDLLDESSSQVVRLVDQVLVTAYRRSASDIHVEPSAISKKTHIRFRMDGVCQEYLQVPNSMARGILSRLKIMAGLDIAERRLPQDGKIKFRRKGVPSFELRIATMPTAEGFEDAVLRILAMAGAMKISEMGLTERNLRVLKRIISQPYGLVLCVGPTGSGKTTTLHAALGHINQPGIKIWTAEDPIEITQKGLRQVEVKPKIGLNFARVMRSFLRADPDVIMIGEMRDTETAAIGIEASLTGHLVFSTLHTNSAPETVTRLLDMGLNALNFSDAFLGVIAQRLVRKLCKDCRQTYHPTREEFQEIAAEYGEQALEAAGIRYDPEMTFYRPGGCEECSGTGYRGRLGIHELMEGTTRIKRLIKKQANTEEIFEQAVQEGMTTLKQDAILKVFEGLTDFSEVRRVCIH